MATTPQTQAYISLAVAEAAKRPGIRTALATLLQQLGDWQQSIARQTQACQQALMVEADVTILQDLEHEKQTLGALRREVSEVERQLGELRLPLAQQDRYQQTFAADATARGYLIA